MTTECSVCYVSDINYLLPSMASAVSLRKFVAAHTADVTIFLVDQEEARVQELNKLARPFGIEIRGMDSSVYSTFDQNKFHQSSVPHTTLGRFFIDEMLPSSCTRIVYIDGDTWIKQDPSVLIDAIVPDGKFAAVEDMMSFRYSHVLPRGRVLLPYFKNLGIQPKNGYFNAGVFATPRKTWKSLAPEGFKFFLENTTICKYHDQSALNAIIGDRRIRLSLKWNFQTPFRFLGIEQKANPHIYHFHSWPKPWMAPVEPWKEMFPDYQAVLPSFASMNLPVKVVSDDQLAHHNKLNWRKRLLRNVPLVAKIASLHTGASQYENYAWL